MPSSLDTEDVKGMFSLFKGESGSGKSVGALSFPNVYLFDFDKKMPAIARKHFPGKDIQYDTFPGILEVASRINELEYSCPFETLVFDSVTSLCNMVINTTAQLKGEDTIKQLKMIKPNNKTETMTIDYYNNEVRYIQNYWIDALKRLWAQPGNPRHVIVIAHVMIVESAPDLKTKLTTTSRGIVTSGKKVGAYIPTQFDDMFHFTTRNYLGDSKVSHVCRTEAAGDDNAKTAYRLPAEIDFTDGSLYDLLCKADPSIAGPNTSSDEGLEKKYL